MEKVAIVITILNEEATLPLLFRALEYQTRKPDQVMIVDGGSTDGSQALLRQWKPKFKFTWIVRRGNRSVGRNQGIAKVSADIIAITDAGCRPQKDWFGEIIRPLLAKEADVVSGYYKPEAKTAFEQAASAYMLVMPENINSHEFLPATRSMAITKTFWQKAGRFPEEHGHNEDYVFARSLKAIGARIKFVRKAEVIWIPPKRWGIFLKQIWRFAYGDTSAGIIRPKMVSIFLRWFFFCALLFLRFELFVAFISLYSFWAYLKNRVHVTGLSGIRILPLMQVATDFVVMVGSLQGLLSYSHAKKH